MNDISRPTVSVIVPNYNHARFLRQRIDTILVQTYQDFELILLDDCSTDDSRSVLREYASHPRVSHVVFNEQNSGSTFRQWNKGVRLARGKYVWIAESDDYAEPILLERLVPRLDEDSTVVLAYCRSCVATEEGLHSGTFVDFDGDPLNPMWKADFCISGAELCRRCFVLDNPIPNGSAVVFRKAVYDELGGADESLRTCGDWKIWAALSMLGKVAYASEPLNYFRSHGRSVRGAFLEAGGRMRTAYIEERLGIVADILNELGAPRSLRRQAYAHHARIWALDMISPRVPLGAKKTVIRAVRRFDPHPSWSFLCAAPWHIWQVTRESKLRWLTRNYVWHPALGMTRRVRHAIGINHDNVRAVLKRLTPSSKS
jgi:glycosyltransferase involved in cell wall biosynthesis